MRNFKLNKLALTSCCKRLLGNPSVRLKHVNLLSTQVQPKIDSPKATTDVLSLNPINHEDYFGVKKMVTVKNLFDARVHYGHREGSLNEHMLPYIFGSRMGHLIFDLDKTLHLLHQALNFAAHMAYKDGIILFVTQSPQHCQLIEKTALECKEFAHTRAWRQGMLTNSTMMFGAVTRLPDLMIFFNTLSTVLEEHWAVREAAKMSIPTIGVVDTNCNPNLFTYPIPGNDDSPAAMQFYCQIFKEVIMKGKEERKKNIELCKS